MSLLLLMLFSRFKLNFVTKKAVHLFNLRVNLAGIRTSQLSDFIVFFFVNVIIL